MILFIAIMMIMVRMMVIIMAREPGLENSGSKLPGVGVSIRIIKPITESDGAV